MHLVTSKIFFYELLGFPVPGNYTMSAILALMLETYMYGLFIILLVTYAIAYICDRFIVDSLVLNTCNYKFNRYYPKKLRDRYGFFSPYYFRSYNFPSYFSKRCESLLDICFLVFPTVIVVLILVPTLGFLYNSEFHFDNVSTALWIDVIGHQWYWTYEYTLGDKSMYFSFENADFAFDSILDVDALVNVNLEVDRRVVIPTDVFVSLSITSTDVIHSWAVPQLGIKIDAIPGRIANTILHSFMDGVYYGQCSELCGVLHGFMPICVESVSSELFFFWVYLNTNALSFLNNFSFLLD